MIDPLMIDPFKQNGRWNVMVLLVVRILIEGGDLPKLGFAQQRDLVCHPIRAARHLVLDRRGRIGRHHYRKRADFFSLGR